MSTQLDNYYLKHPEPLQGCLLALKDIILGVNEHITNERKYQIPFFCYKGMKLGFLWVNRKKLLLGFVEDRNILSFAEGVKRKDNFETIVIDPEADLPVKTIVKKLQQLIKKYDKADKKRKAS